MVGVVLLAGGLIGIVTAATMSKSAYESNQPARVAAGLKPRPGSGDVPGWISGVYLISLICVVVGIIALIAA